MPTTADGSSRADTPFLPPARLMAPTDSAVLTAPGPSVGAPTLPSSRKPGPPTSSPAAPAFDARAMAESQKHFNVNPAYGAMPTGTDDGRAAARRLREQANRTRRRRKIAGRIVAVLLLAGLAVGGYFAYQSIQDDPTPADGTLDDADGALTPLGEQQPVIEALDDVNSGATPSAGALLDAVDDARTVVGQAEPPVAGGTELLVADLLTPVILDHTEVLSASEGYERFVVRTDDLVGTDPSAHAALVERLLALPQAVAGEPQLAIAPVVPAGDIAIAIQRDGDTILRIIAVSVDPVIRSIGP